MKLAVCLNPKNIFIGKYIIWANHSPESNFDIKIKGHFKRSILLKTRTVFMNAKISVFVIYVAVIIYLLLYNLDDYTFKFRL